MQKTQPQVWWHLLGTEVQSQVQTWLPRIKEERKPETRALRNAQLALSPMQSPHSPTVSMHLPSPFPLPKHLLSAHDRQHLVQPAETQRRTREQVPFSEEITTQLEKTGCQIARHRACAKPNPDLEAFRISQRVNDARPAPAHWLGEKQTHL